MKNANKLKMILLWVMSLLLMSGCESTTVIKVPSCDGFKLIYPSRLDTLETKEQILAHNEFFEAHCSNGGGLESSNPQ